MKGKCLIGKAWLSAMVVMLCCWWSVVPSAECFAGDSGTAAPDAIYGVINPGERVINLPQDQEKWHISIIGSRRSAVYRAVLSWFNTNPDLKTLKEQTHFHPIATNTTMFRERYAPSTPVVPCVRMQDAAGVVTYEASGAGIPRTSDDLLEAMRDGIAEWHRCRPRPEPKPVPKPKPEPKPQPIIHNGPPVLPHKPRSSFPPVWLLVLLGLGGAAVGVVAEWRKTYSKTP